MKKVLIVEDDFYIGDIYTLSFTEAGYEVDLAVDGEQGIEKAASQSYDLILLDIMLPKQNGIEVLRMLRQPNSPTVTTPVFLITNLGQENIVDEAFKIGADGYILKAKLSPQEVVREVSEFLHKQEHKQSASPNSSTYDL